MRFVPDSAAPGGCGWCIKFVGWSGIEKSGLLMYESANNYDTFNRRVKNIIESKARRAHPFLLRLRRVLHPFFFSLGFFSQSFDQPAGAWLISRGGALLCWHGKPTCLSRDWSTSVYLSPKARGSTFCPPLISYAVDGVQRPRERERERKRGGGDYRIQAYLSFIHHT